MQGFLTKVGRQCYAVFCLGVVLVSAAVAHYVYHLESSDESTFQFSDQQSRPRRHV